MPKRRNTARFIQFRLDHKQLKGVFSLIGCEWGTEEEKQWRELITGKRKSFTYPSEFKTKFKDFITKIAPELKQSRLFDLSNIPSIDLNLFPQKTVEAFFKKVTIHQQGSYELREAKKLRALLRLERKRAKIEAELIGYEITLKEAKQYGLTKHKIVTVGDELKVKNRKLHNVQNKISEAQIAYEQQLEIRDYIASFPKDERNIIRKQIVKLLLAEHGLKYTGRPRQGAALKIIDKDNIASHKRRKMPKQDR